MARGSGIDDENDTLSSAWQSCVQCIFSRSTAVSQKCLAMMLLACGATISERNSFSQILKNR